VGIVLVTPPALEPVTLADAKLHLRESDTGQDTLITALVTAARKAIEERCRRSLVTQTWMVTLDQFPSPLSGSALWAPFEIGIPRIPPGDPGAGDLRRKWSGIRLPRGPVIAITSIKYYDATGAFTTLAPAAYEVDVTAPVAIVAPAIAAPWPVTQVRLNAVEVRYTAGWGPAATDVPGDIVAAIKLLVGHLYEQRETVNVGNITTEIPWTVDALIAPYELPEAA
jgi:Phage gp6-like head-tail connector protein